MRGLLSIVFIVLSIVMLPIALAAVVLLVQSEINHSRFFACGILSLFFAVYLLAKRFLSDIGYSGTWAFMFFVITGGLWGAAYVKSPKGFTDDPQSGFESVYSDEVFYPRWHPANLVAERDQVRLALFASAYAGMDFDDSRSSEARKALKSTYDDMTYLAPDLVDYGTQLPALYQSWGGKQTDQIHRYVYRSPKGSERPSMPVILVLHGHGGNIKAGPWAFKRLADEIGMAVVAPTFGKGDWESADAKNRLEEALAFIKRQPNLDSASVILAGYGTGGRGVLVGAQQLPHVFKGYVHISSPITEATIEPFTNSGSLKDLNTLVIHGARDRLVRAEEVEKATAILNRWQMPIIYQRFEDEGAVLLFKRNEDVMGRISTWMRNW